MMNQFFMLLVTLHALQAQATIQMVFEKVQEVERKYFELVEVTSQIVNQNANKSNSNYVATVGVTNERYIVDKVLMKISKTVSSPSKIHGLARDAVIFAQNSSSISIEENLDHVHRRGRIVICATVLYSNESEFLEEFTKVASYLWTNRFSRMIFISWIQDELNIFGIRLYPAKTCFPTELIKIATVKSGKILKTKPFWEKIKNLNQCLLRVATASEIPYAEIYVESNVTLVKGIEGNIFNILSKRMNFTPLISDIEKIPDFHARFVDRKDIIRANESDLYFAAKKINMDGLEPTVPIMDCQKIWIVPKGGSTPPWMQVMIPFEKSVWLTLAFTLFFIGVICRFLDEEVASLTNMWSLFLGVSVGMRNTPARRDVKIFLSFWMFFSYVITHSYLAALEGYLTWPTCSSEIDTLEDLVASGMPIKGHRIVSLMFCPTETEMGRDICRRFRVKSTRAIYEEIRSRGKVEFGFTMKAEIYRNSKFFRDYDTHVMQEALLKYPTAFIVQTGAPFLDEMNVIITRLIEAGFVDLWQRQNILIQEKKKHYPEELRVEHVSGILFVTALGYTISIIVFCGECLVNSFYFEKLKNTLKLSKYKNRENAPNVQSPGNICLKNCRTT